MGLSLGIVFIFWYFQHFVFESPFFVLFLSYPIVHFISLYDASESAS